MLPESWVDHLFGRLSVRYGAAFTRQWPDTDLDIVKADWRVVLSRLSGEAIAYGLDNLPADRPPNALQFRAICNARPADDGALKLPAPTYHPTDEQIAALKRAREGLFKRSTGQTP